MTEKLELKLRGFIETNELNGPELKDIGKYIGIVSPHKIKNENNIDCNQSCIDCKYFKEVNYFDLCTNQNVIDNYISKNQYQ